MINASDKIIKEMKVAIVGAGPVGLTLGLYLRKFNIDFKLFEKMDRLQGYIIRAPSSAFHRSKKHGAFQ